MNITEKIEKYLSESKEMDWSSIYKKSNYKYNDGLDAIMYFFENTKDDDNVFAQGIFGFWKTRATNDKSKSEIAYTAAEEALFERESEVRSAINSGNVNKIVKIAQQIQGIINGALD